MKSLLVQSVFLMWIVIPALAARDTSARRGLRRTLLAVLVSNTLYVIYLTLVHVNVYAPHR